MNQYAIEYSFPKGSQNTWLKYIAYHYCTLLAKLTSLATRKQSATKI